MTIKKKQYLFGSWNLALLAFVVLALAFFTIKSVQNKQVAAVPIPKVTVSMSPVQATLVKNKQSNFSVFVSGDDAKNALASDVRLTFDRNYFKIISVKPGGFYSKPMTVKFNYQTNSFSLALSPSEKGKEGSIDPTKPILLISVMPLKESLNPLSFNVGSDTQLYLTSTKTGAFPKVSGSNVTINAK